MKIYFYYEGKIIFDADVPVIPRIDETVMAREFVYTVAGVNYKIPDLYTEYGVYVFLKNQIKL